MRTGLISILMAFPLVCFAQSSQPTPPASSADDLRIRVQQLETEVAELKQIVNKLQPAANAPAPLPTANVSDVEPAKAESTVTAQEPSSHSLTSAPTAEDQKTLGFLRGTTISLGLDAYYDFNFNQPVGRVNLLRAYDVLSNEFSLNQADVILEHAPDLSAGRRWGARLDLQFGQATDTLQGNPFNEPRPGIYRNVFQAYGTYVAPIGKGVTVDFGKWGSSLGIEGNYTKDQINYSRSFWFNFLPFYHMGVRASIPVTERFSFNYWVVNGTN